MASKELSHQLQRRLQWEQAEKGDAAAGVPGPAPGAPKLPSSADEELRVQLSRRLDISAGAAQARHCRVFHPYSEFPEFSRRLIKDLEKMFKL